MCNIRGEATAPRKLYLGASMNVSHTIGIVHLILAVGLAYFAAPFLLTWTVLVVGASFLADGLRDDARSWSEFICAWFHGGGWIGHDDDGVHWKCAKCGRKVY